KGYAQQQPPTGGQAALNFRKFALELRPAGSQLALSAFEVLGGAVNVASQPLHSLNQSPVLYWINTHSACLISMPTSHTRAATCAMRQPGCMWPYIAASCIQLGHSLGSHSTGSVAPAYSTARLMGGLRSSTCLLVIAIASPFAAGPCVLFTEFFTSLHSISSRF